MTILMNILRKYKRGVMMKRKHNLGITMNEGKDINIMDFTFNDERFEEMIRKELLDFLSNNINEIAKEIGFDVNNVNMSGISSYNDKETRLKIALINALEYIQEITNYDMHEVETLLGLKVNAYLELTNEDL